MKIVIIVNKDLPVGLAANTAAVLGISLGSFNKDIVGPDCLDGSKILHKGITEKNIPILAADSKVLKKLYKNSMENENIETIDFNRIAQINKNYADYSTQLAEVKNRDLEFSGLCLKGPEKEIKSLTGSIGLYR